MNEEIIHLVRHLSNRLSMACEKANLTVNPEICDYLVNLELIRWKGKSDGQELVEECIKNLTENPVWMRTVKMQVYWKEKYLSKEEIKRYHHETIYKNVLPILSEIVESSRLKSTDKDILYRKIVIFIIMFAGLGCPTQQAIITETQAALYSIFKNTEVDNFMALSKSVKEEQLFEFARIVTGIRLFNKDCKKGGEGIEDLPLILSQGVKATKDRIMQFKSKVDRRLDRLFNVVHHIYGIGTASDRLIIQLNEDKLEEVKDLLIYHWQTEMCLKNIIKDVDESLVSIDELVEKLQFTLLQVHDVVRYRVAIATVQVFPLFLQLSDVWVEMQEEVDILSEINNNFVELSSIAEVLSPGLAELIFRPINESFLPPKTVDIVYDPAEFHEGVKLCSQSPESRLQYEGFCAWTLAQAEGVLVTGNVSIGVLSFESLLYTFSSADAAYKWAKDPKYYIEKAFNIISMKPELIKMLNMTDDLKPGRKETQESCLEKEAKPEMAHVEIQTELHPIESFISRDYTFSHWELMRRALKLGDLTRCLTKSQQTIKRRFPRREIGLQVTPVSSRETQTKKSVGCLTKSQNWGLEDPTLVLSIPAFISKRK